MPQKLINSALTDKKDNSRDQYRSRLSVIGTCSKTDCDRQRVGVAAVEDECVGARLNAVEVELVVHVAHAAGLRIVFILALIDVNGLAVAAGADDDAAIHLGGAAIDRQVVVRHMQPLAVGIVDHARRVGTIEALGFLIDMT